MKSSPAQKLALLALACTGLSAVLLAEDIPLANWAVPPYHASSASGGLTTMGDGFTGTAFVAYPPCRLVDTRNAGFPAGYGPPALVAGVPRNFDINSQPNCPGIPPASAYSLNFTVTQTQGPGFLKVFPQGGAVPADVSTINYVGGQTIANAAIVPAASGGGITVIAGVSGTHVIIDVNGYFTNTYNPGTLFFQIGDVSGGPVGSFLNAASANGSTGVHGRAFGSGGGTSGHIFGGKFETYSTSFDSAGVKGVNGSGDPLGDTVDCTPCLTAGVRGVGNDAYGVLGISRTYGVTGVLLASTGTVDLAAGYLGTNFGTDTDGGGPPWAVFGAGNIGATGIKPFLEPHPTDPSLIIQYVALEGPEAGTYFRGKGKFERGTAVIEVPEDFRMVTDSEGLSIQVTPIGEMATVAVKSIGLDRIVIQGSRNVEFFYTVNGVRRTFKDQKPIRRGSEFAPAKAEATIPGYLSETQKRLLIQNGTYRPDGTVNMETARRLGWDRVWAERERPKPQPTEPTTP
jgi:hypothetical protein